MNCLQFSIRSLPMKNHHEVGHFKSRLMIVLLSLFALLVTAGQSLAATDCSTCHGMPPLDSADGSRNPATGAFAGSHQAHLGGTAVAADCTVCHGNSGYPNNHAAISGFNIKMNSSINGGTYSNKGVSFPQSANPILGKCSNVSCHDNGLGVAVDSPTWGDSSTPACSACHAAAPATRAHTKHLSGLNTNFNRNAVCADCHRNYVQGSTVDPLKHTDGNVDVYFTTIGDLGYPAVNPKGDTPNSCTTSYCHSNGRSSFASVSWGTTSTGCGFCHPNLSAGHAKHVGTLQAEISFYAYTSNKSNSAGNKFGCANCHPLTVASHINNNVDVDMTASVSGGSLKAKNGAWTYNGSFQCINVYCHSNGLKPSYTFALTPAWLGSFTGDRCAACHGNSPGDGIAGSSAHAIHSVGIHYDDIFNGVSKKLPFGGGRTILGLNAAHGNNSRSTTINCNICHFSVVTAFANDLNTLCTTCHKGGGNPAPLFGNMSVANHTKHVNGSVDVDFINQKIATKAQVVPSAFAAYTANASGWDRRSNAMKFKTYTSSYDYTKTTLVAAASPYTTAAGCLNIACHASIPVKWTDAVSCQSCHVRLK
jgi:predicted CxxxxCH...CXXCH cytochrome family protein